MTGAVQEPIAASNIVASASTAKYLGLLAAAARAGGGVGGVLGAVLKDAATTTIEVKDFYDKNPDRIPGTTSRRASNTCC